MKERVGRLWSLRRRMGGHGATADGTRQERDDAATTKEWVTTASSIVEPIDTTPLNADRAVADNTTSEFDRELEQYRLVEETLTDRRQVLRAKMDECRDGGDLLVDYQRCLNQARRVEEQLADLIRSRDQYLADRDRLAAWGSTDDWVVAGSIVTIQYLDGHRDTFVLTERPLDTEYETVSYDSPLGRAVRRRRVGDKVSLPAGAQLTIADIAPGFRVHSNTADRRSDHSKVRPNSAAAEGAPAQRDAERWIAKQRCSDKAYRDDLYRRRTDPNVRPINEYVDLLRSQRPGQFIPYVAPTYGGIRARLLTLMQDPGPKTDTANHNGSGMICLENADLTAARQKYFMAEAGVDVSQIVSWNAYPWPKPHPQTDDSDREAAVALRCFLELIPQLEVVVLNGVVAKRVWGVMKKLDRSVAVGVCEFPTFHTSPRAVDPDVRSVEYIESVNRDLRDKYIAAARKLDMT